MALGNGLLVHGPTHWAAAVRTDAGEVKVRSGRKPDLGGAAAERVPGVRGVLKLAEAIALVPMVKRALPEARLLRRPGYEIQRLVGTREPSPEQLEVGRAALEEILRVEGASVPR